MKCFSMLLLWKNKEPHFCCNEVKLCIWNPRLDVWHISVNLNCKSTLNESQWCKQTIAKSAVHSQTNINTDITTSCLARLTTNLTTSWKPQTSQAKWCPHLQNRQFPGLSTTLPRSKITLGMEWRKQLRSKLICWEEEWKRK